MWDASLCSWHLKRFIKTVISLLTLCFIYALQHVSVQVEPINAGSSRRVRNITHIPGSFPNFAVVRG